MMNSINKNLYKSIEGEFENYYYQYEELLYNSFMKLDIEKCFQNSEDKDSCLQQLIEGILYQLSNVCSYSILDFFNYKKKNNQKLTYYEFNKNLINKETIKEFNCRYPVVLKKCHNIIDNYTSRIEEVFGIIKKYRKNILDFINAVDREGLNITSIDLFKGDFHRDTFVVILIVQNNKIVIKKRTSLGENILGIFSKYFENDSIHIPLAKTKILNENLNIQSFVQSTKNLSQADLNNYYYKFGLMAGIFTILGSKDLHNENLLITDDGPCFIDLESPITYETPPQSYSFLKESNLFNSNINGKVYLDLDISAFSGDDINIEKYTIKNKGKNDIFLGTKKCVSKRNNIPSDINGKKVIPFKYSNSVKLGFKVANEIFLKYKNQIIKECGNLNGYEYRIVLRNTGFYEQYLQYLNFPLYTKSSLKTSQYINLLKKNSVREPKVVNEEISCLKNNIIPYFISSLFVPTEVVRERFIDRLKNYSKKNVEKEYYYLKMFLGDDSEKSKIDYTIPEKRIDSEIKNFISYCSNNDFFKYGAIDFSIIDKPLDYYNDLYTFGLSLKFILSTGQLFGREEIVKKTIEINKSKKQISGLTGYQSGLFLKNLCGVKNVSNNYISADNMVTNADIIDFSTYGSAILVLDYLYNKTKINYFLKDIIFLGNIYLKNYSSRNLTGLFHGYAGDIVTLTTINKYIKKSDLNEKIKTLLKKENNFYNNVENNWNDNRNKGLKDNDSLCAISYGAPGIIISRLFLYNNFKLSDPIQKTCYDDIKLGVLGILRKKREDFKDDTLINGYAGAVITLKIILECKILEDNKELVRTISKYIDDAKEILTKAKWRYHGFENLLNPTFFNGRIGTTFTLWYIIFYYSDSFLSSMLCNNDRGEI